MAKPKQPKQQKQKQKQRQTQKTEQTQKVSIRIGDLTTKKAPRRRRKTTTQAQQQQQQPSRQYSMPQSIVISNSMLPSTYTPPVFSPPIIYERNTLANKLLEKEGTPTQLYQPQLETATKKYDFDAIPEEAKKNIIQRGSQPADNIDNNITKKSQSSRGGLGELLMSGASMLGKYAFEKMTEETKPQKVTFRETQTEPDQGAMERIKPELSTTKMEQTIMPLEKIVPQLSTTETQTEPKKPKLNSDVFKKMHEKQQAERKELEKPKKKILPVEFDSDVTPPTTPVRQPATIETPLSKEELAVIKRREYQNARNAKIRAEKLAKEQEQQAKTKEVGEFVSLTKAGIPRATSKNIRLITGQTPKPTRKIAQPNFEFITQNQTPSKSFQNFY